MKNTINEMTLNNQAATHEVFNQAPPLVDYNAWQMDTAMAEAVCRHGGEWGNDELLALGEKTGSAEVIDWGFLANRVLPEFHSHDRYGHRIDEVEYHPAYHALMRQAREAGIHSTPWTEPRSGAHVVRAAKSYLHAQVEAGHGCPMTMTFAAIPTLRMAPDLAEQWLPKILARSYDSRNLPHSEKTSLTIGMGMTEKQGGSDVRSNTTTAIATDSDSASPAYELTGHKWFLSAPMCDGFLMLAQTTEGPSCFLVPRWRPDGSKNPLQLQRLKNKVGNQSNASSEVELRRAFGWIIGDPGRGVRSIIEMVALTRFDCMIGSSAGQRQAVAQAVHHATHRKAFGKRLIDQPLMRNVLADLQLEVEGSIALTMRIGQSLDTLHDEHEKQLMRLGTAVGKYWICKRTPAHAYEAMECLGGNGVTEEFIMARLYREAPINAIWEGSGNVQALDLLRALSKSPEVLDAWFREMEGTRGQNTHLDRAISELKKAFHETDDMEYRARDLTSRLALTMQASLLYRAGNADVADAFTQSRLGSANLHSYGCLPRGLGIDQLLQRADPMAR